MPPHSRFEARRIAVELEILTPPFPDDVEHLEDGSWTCSAESFQAMASSFTRFGFSLSYAWTFDTLYDNYTFVLRAACLIPRIESGKLENEFSTAMVEYLRAVKNRAPRRIEPALVSVMAERANATQAVAQAERQVPKLRLV